MAWPTSLETYTTKVDNTEYVDAADINDLQATLTNLQQGLGVGTNNPLVSSLYGSFGTVNARINNIESHLYGLNSAWTLYTPTIGGTGWSGHITFVVAKYRQIDPKTVAFRYEFTFDGTVGSTALTLALPSGMVTPSAGQQVLHGWFQQVGLPSFRSAKFLVNGGASVFTVWILRSGSDAEYQEVTTGGAGYIPSNGDQVNGQGVIEIA